MCVTDLDKQSEMIIFESILTTFEVSGVIFWDDISDDFQLMLYTTIQT